MTEPHLKWLSVEAIRKQCRIEHCQEDDKLEAYGASAEQAILNLCDRTFEEFIEEYGMIPAPVRHASLLLAQHFYDHPGIAEQGNLSVIPYTFDLLVKPYMKL